MNFSTMRTGKVFRICELFLVRRAVKPAEGTGSVSRRTKGGEVATDLNFSG
jgi:hypothetical protein